MNARVVQSAVSLTGTHLQIAEAYDEHLLGVGSAVTISSQQKKRRRERRKQEKAKTSHGIDNAGTTAVQGTNGDDKRQCEGREDAGRDDDSDDGIRAFVSALSCLESIMATTLSSTSVERIFETQLREGCKRYQSVAAFLHDHLGWVTRLCCRYPRSPVDAILQSLFAHPAHSSFSSSSSSTSTQTSCVDASTSLSVMISTIQWNDYYTPFSPSVTTVHGVQLTEDEKGHFRPAEHRRYMYLQAAEYSWNFTLPYCLYRLHLSPWSDVYALSAERNIAYLLVCDWSAATWLRNTLASRPGISVIEGVLTEVDCCKLYKLSQIRHRSKGTFGDYYTATSETMETWEKGGDERFLELLSKYPQRDVMMVGWRGRVRYGREARTFMTRRIERAREKRKERWAEVTRGGRRIPQGVDKISPSSSSALSQSSSPSSSSSAGGDLSSVGRCTASTGDSVRGASQKVDVEDGSKLSSREKKRLKQRRAKRKAQFQRRQHKRNVNVRLNSSLLEE